MAESISDLDQIMRTTVGGLVDIQTDLPPDALSIEADPSQFETAVLNMLVNARDAMPDGGRVTIAVSAADAAPAVRGHAAAHGNFVAISISDSGTGMDPVTLTRIFEPFFTTKPVDKGTGLGLSQVYGFAKQSGGEIDAKSELGIGTSFTLYLPRCSASIAAPSESPNPIAAVPLPARRILLVEDNEAVGSFAAELLQELGQSVRWEGDGQSALEALRREKGDFDLVFSDVVMPGMTGVELAHKIKAEWPGLEVILTSGYSHVLADEGTHGFELLKKPYSIEGLLTALRRK